MSDNARFRSVFYAAIIVLLGLVVYSNTFSAPFQFDDREYIIDNPIIRDPVYFLGRSLPPETNLSDNVIVSARTRYMGYLSFYLNYTLHGFDVWGYHVFNLAVHLVNALLVYVLMRFTLRTAVMIGSASAGHARPLALFAALLFVSHPVQTQAVTYITQRFTSIAAMFYLISVLSYAGYRLVDGNGRKYALYAMMLFSAVLAMKSKENSFTLPFAILMYELLFFTGNIRKRIVPVLPLMLTLLIVPLSLRDTFLPVMEPQGLSRSYEYLFTQFRVIVTYLRLLVFPIGQNLDYDFPEYDTFLAPQVWGSFLFLLCIVAFGGYLLFRGRRPEARLGAFGIFWFFLALSVESSFVPLDDIIFEHRLYLPSAGLFSAVAVMGGMFAIKIEGSRMKGLFLFAFIFAICIFSVAAYSRNLVWGSQIGLWQDTYYKSPGKARVLNNLGNAYMDNGWLERAEGMYKAALAVEPDKYETLDNLGSVYRKQGRYHEARAMHLRALALNPDFARAANNLGLAYTLEGEHEKALEMYRHAMSLSPRDPASLNNMANEYARGGRPEEAEELYLQALDQRPHYAEALYNLALLYNDSGRREEALRVLLDAVRRYPARKEVRYSLANFYMNLEMPQEAIEQYRAALALEPGDLNAHVNIAAAYFRVGDMDRSIEHLREAVGIAPGDREAHYNLGIALRAKGLQEEARQHLEISESLGGPIAGE